MAVVALFLVLAIARASAMAPAPAPKAATNATSQAAVDFVNSLISVTDQNTTLSKLQESGLANAFFSLPEATLIAPSDAAWASLSPEVYAMLNGTNGKTVLQNLLLAHIIPQFNNDVLLSATTYDQKLPTLLKHFGLYVAPVGGQVYLSQMHNNFTKNYTIVEVDISAFQPYACEGIEEVIVPHNLTLLMQKVPYVPAPAPAPAPSSSMSSFNASVPSASNTSSSLNTSISAPTSSTSSSSSGSPSAPAPTSGAFSVAVNWALTALALVSTKMLL